MATPGIEIDQKIDQLQGEPGSSIPCQQLTRNWDRIESVLLGNAVGDSLGATSEFQIPWDVGKLMERYDGWPGKIVGGGKAGWRRGAPTDDTEMMMAILRSLVRKKGKFDMRSVSKYFVKWKNTGPLDIGMCTAVTLGYLQRHHVENVSEGAREYWTKNSRSAANGSLMRNGIVPAFFAHESLDLVLTKSVKQSIITHYGPLPVICCAIHSYLIRHALQNEPANLKAPTFEDIKSFLETEWKAWLKNTNDETIKHWVQNVSKKAIKKAQGVLLKDLKDFENYDPWNQDYRGRSGYCNLTLLISLWALHWSFRSDRPENIPKWLEEWIFTKHGFDAIMWVVTIGADADTYGATAGALLAAYHPKISEELLDGLEVRQEINDSLLKIQEEFKSMK